MTAPHAVLEEVPPARKAEEPGPGRGRRRIGGPMAPVEIRDLSKRFGAVAAVNHLSFDIEPGRVTGFLGPNGAGKSTTLRALLGLVQPSSGAATFGGLRLVIIAAAIEPAVFSAVPKVGRLLPLAGAPSGVLGGTHGCCRRTGLAVMVAWTLTIFAPAAWRLRSRDLV